MRFTISENGDSTRKRNYGRIAVSRQKVQKAPSFLFRRHNATSNAGWIKLMRLATPNRVLHRAKEINETVLCWRKKKKNKEKEEQSRKWRTVSVKSQT